MYILAFRRSIIYERDYWFKIRNINEYFNKKIDLLRDNLVKIKVNNIPIIVLGFIEFNQV